MPSPVENSAYSPKKNLSAAEIEDANKLFQKIDLDGSGCIDLLELTKMFDEMEDVNMNETEIMLLFQEIDLDRDGVINFTEFLRAVALQKIQREKRNDDANLTGAFEQCGGNRDQTGSAERGKVAALLKEFDLDIDVESVFEDRISYKQFQEVFG